MRTVVNWPSREPDERVGEPGGVGQERGVVPGSSTGSIPNLSRQAARWN
jgi:hypothetical protein